jgi:hypothetical protein
MPHRHTIVAHGRLAKRELRLVAARERRHGRQIMTFEQLAARLAGGFASPVDMESLRAAIQVALPLTALGELDSIKLLPGMVDAAADTFTKSIAVGRDYIQSRLHFRLVQNCKFINSGFQRKALTDCRKSNYDSALLAQFRHHSLDSCKYTLAHSNARTY